MQDQDGQNNNIPIYVTDSVIVMCLSLYAAIFTNWCTIYCYQLVFSCSIARMLFVTHASTKGNFLFMLPAVSEAICCYRYPKYQSSLNWRYFPIYVTNCIILMCLWLSKVILKVEIYWYRYGSVHSSITIRFFIIHTSNKDNFLFKLPIA